MISYIRGKLKKIDSIADEVGPVQRLNFDKHTEYKSELGGLCTIVIYVTFILVLIKEAIPVLNLEDPKV